jgi:hypothetical protein
MAILLVVVAMVVVVVMVVAHVWSSKTMLSVSFVVVVVVVTGTTTMAIAVDAVAVAAATMPAAIRKVVERIVKGPGPVSPQSLENLLFVIDAPLRPLAPCSSFAEHRQRHVVCNRGRPTAVLRHAVTRRRLHHALVQDAPLLGAGILHGFHRQLKDDLVDGAPPS